MHRDHAQVRQEHQCAQAGFAVDVGGVLAGDDHGVEADGLLARSGADVVAADFSAGMIAEGRRRHSGIPNLTFAEADAALDRIRSFQARVARIDAPFESSAERPETDAEPENLFVLPAAFAAAMDDDLGVPQALAAVHETVRRGNAALDAGDTDAASIAAWSPLVRAAASAVACAAAPSL